MSLWKKAELVYVYIIYKMRSLLNCSISLWRVFCGVYHSPSNVGCLGGIGVTACFAHSDCLASLSVDQSIFRLHSYAFLYHVDNEGKSRM